MEYHVAVSGSDQNDGSASRPLRTISAAAQRAQPGDIVTVHEGTYREWISPPRGGVSDERRIVYRAAAGEQVVIKGSEIVRRWSRVGGDVWQAVLPNIFFGAYNPYRDRIRGDWFNPRGRNHHTGRVYLNERPLVEAASCDEVKDRVTGPFTWYAEVGEETTVIWANFAGADPNLETVEINVRPAIFYPKRPGVNYITVRGFVMRHAATQWAPPTTQQMGLVGTHWSKGWIIENNVISDSRCAGITLGKYDESIDHVEPTADRYNQTIQDALKKGWNRETIGHHLVQNNTIYNCEQAGIAGSMGAAFSIIRGNHIHHIHVERTFTGAEMAGIKFHGPIDTVIEGNRIHHTCLGIWLDWMTQGTRVTSNLLYENDRDVFVEVNHGPFVFDNNLLLSSDSIFNMSEGGAYVHNLISGRIRLRAELMRSTPFHAPHSTEVRGLSWIRGGDDRYYNNLFVGGNGLSAYDETCLDWLRHGAAREGISSEWVKQQIERWHELGEPHRFPVWMAGNVFFGSAEPSKREEGAKKQPHPPRIKVVEHPENGEVTLQIDLGEGWRRDVATELVTTEVLGEACVPHQRYTRPDDTALRVDVDYLGNSRQANPTPGPFEELPGGRCELKVWPRPQGSKE